MNLTRHHGGAVILVTLAIAMLLAIIPLPDSLRIYRPDWVALVLIYWCLAIPERVGVVSGWVAGLFLDVLTSSLLGQHAMALCIVAFLAVRMHQQLRVYPLWQQSLSVLVLLLVNHLVLLWINSIIGQQSPGFIYWLPAIIGAALWPLVYGILRTLRQSFSVR